MLYLGLNNADFTLMKIPALSTYAMHSVEDITFTTISEQLCIYKHVY